MNDRLDRRKWLQQASALGASGVLASTCLGVKGGIAQDAVHSESATTNDSSPGIRYCLNTSTIRGQELALVDEIELVAKVGYDGIEPWIREIDRAVEQGHSPAELKTRIADAGLTVESAIGFASWIVDDPGERRKGLEQMKRDMELVQSLGGTRIAAPPAGATNQADLSLPAAAERYAAIVELGRSFGVVPQLEVWGFSKSLSRLGEVIHVAIESGQADACILPDVYHIFKGGSDFRGLAMIDGGAIQVMHLNDYPGGMPRESMADKDRVYPGDGIAPLANIIHQMRQNGFQGTFSLELFNPTYWQQPAEDVCRTGLEKMKTAVAASDSVTGW